MTWSNEEQLKYLLHLPWSVLISTEDGELVARVVELPSVLATGRKERELGHDLWIALRATLESYLLYGDEVPLPPGSKLPWEEGKSPPQPVEPMRIFECELGEAWATSNRAAVAVTA